MDKIKFGCFCDIEEGMDPYECVIDSGNYDNCFYAKKGMKKEDCIYWLPLDQENLEKIYIDELSNIIREIDGNHELGAGAIAEKLLDRLVIFKRGNN